MIATDAPVQEVGRADVQRWLPELDDWLLPGAFYGVQHTWPQLYRRDGNGRFFVITDGDRLLAHCATRLVDVQAGDVHFTACLLGSVATAPAWRGRGLAQRVLTHALQRTGDAAAVTLLWAERPALYAHAGFQPGPEETCLLLARRPRPQLAGVRLATVADHAALHALHEQKPWRVRRSPRVMSSLLTTPGMTTLLRELDGDVVAYACCGKGADLAGHWHELGGSDEHVATLLAAALHVTEQTEAMLLLPPWRRHLRERLGAAVVDEVRVAGPMWRSLDGRPRPCWIDGLDSV